MNRRKFISLLSILPFGGWLSTKITNAYSSEIIPDGLPFPNKNSRTISMKTFKHGVKLTNPQTQGGMITHCKNGHEVLAPWFNPIPLDEYNIAGVFARNEDCVVCPECHDIVDLIGPLEFSGNNIRKSKFT